MEKQIYKFSIVLFVSLTLFYMLFENAYTQNITFSLSQGLRLTNNFRYNYEIDFNNIELIDVKSGFSGYLIIQLDSNTINWKYVHPPDTTFEYRDISPTIYFVYQKRYESENRELIIDSALVRLDCDSCRINDLFGSNMFVYDGYFSFLDGKRGELINFLYYYQIFTSIHCFSNDKKWIGQILTTDVLNGKTIWKKSNDKISYIIFEASFDAAIFKLNQKKFYLPMSIVYYFKEAREDILIKHGFIKSKDIIVVK
ncbi:MAG: hypothetical protein NTY74_11840 [Ignavibacteriae bacterium]|nr:hypothetical protein [Ignavibacteriota bacterium]